MAFTPRTSTKAGSGRRCERLLAARRSLSSSISRSTAGSPSRSRSRRTSLRPRSSPTRRSIHRQRSSRCRSCGAVTACVFRFVTTASAVPIRLGVRVSSGSPTASKRSAGHSTFGARRETGRESQRCCRSIQIWAPSTEMPRPPRRVQLGRADPVGEHDRYREAPRGRHCRLSSHLVKMRPTRRTTDNSRPVAQRATCDLPVEHSAQCCRPSNPRVAGSNPAGGASWDFVRGERRAALSTALAQRITRCP